MCLCMRVGKGENGGGWVAAGERGGNARGQGEGRAGEQHGVMGMGRWDGG